MNPIDVIKNAQNSDLTDEDGEKISLTLLPPLTPEQIQTLESRIAQPLPDELKNLLSFCSGIEGCAAQIDFTGEHSFSMEEVFPRGLPIAADGFGNFWVLDITPSTTTHAPVYFACHDAPVILYQSHDIATFLNEVFRMNKPPHESLVVDVHEDRLFNVWKRNPGVITHADALASPEPAIRAFAQTLDANYEIVDLRAPKPGMGFSWGRYGPKTKNCRHGHDPIFAYSKPDRTGFFARLFGKRGE